MAHNTVIPCLSHTTTGNPTHLAYQLIMAFLSARGHVQTLQMLKVELGASTVDGGSDAFVDLGEDVGLASELSRDAYDEKDGNAVDRKAFKGHREVENSSKLHISEQHAASTLPPLLEVLEEYSWLKLQSSLASVSMSDGPRETEETLLATLPSTNSSPFPQPVPSVLLEGIHYGNIVSVSTAILPASLFSPSDIGTADDQRFDSIVSSSADKSVRISSWSQDISTTTSTAQCKAIINHYSSVVLCHCVIPDATTGLGRYLVTGGMDGSLEIVDLHHLNSSSSTLTLLKFTHHRKYLVRIAVSQDTRWMVSGSHDRTVNVYRRCEGTKLAYDLFRTLEFRGPVESLCLIETKNQMYQPTLVVGCREDNYLHYLDLQVDSALTSSPDRVNMNENGDDWVSFSPMDLVPSPSGQHLLCYTDSKVGKVICFPVRSSRHVRTFYGIEADGFSRPRCVWSSCGTYMFATSNDHAICAFSVRTGRLLGRLMGHKGCVRDLFYDATNDRLVSCSYDRTIRVWDLSTNASESVLLC